MTGRETEQKTRQQPERERWIALGTRTGGQNARASAWLDGSGETLLFPDRGSYVVGAAYEARVLRRDGRVTMIGKPSFISRDDWDPHQSAAWEAQSLAAERALARITMERKAKQRTALDDALRPLEQISRSLRTQADRDAFAAYVIRRIQSAW